MSLAVIGSGFGRTGTASLKRALETLGFGPCHHMEEVLAHPEQVPYWQAVFAGESVTGGAFDCTECGYRLRKETGAVTNLPVCPRCQSDRWKAA